MRCEARRHAAPSRPAATGSRRRATSEVSSGYGSMAEYLALGMARAGANVSVAAAFARRATDCSDEFRELLARSAAQPDGPTLYFSWPRARPGAASTAPATCSSTRCGRAAALPAAWPSALNRARAVIVPTRFVARVCRDERRHRARSKSSPRASTRTSTTYVERPDRSGADHADRRPDRRPQARAEGIAAWKLRLRGRPGRAAHRQDAPTTTATTSPTTRASTYVDSRGADTRHRALVRAGRRAAGTGQRGFRPAAGGGDGDRPAGDRPRLRGSGGRLRGRGRLLLRVEPARWEPYDNAPFGRCGVRGVAGVEAVAERLRWVAEHRDEAREMGRAASALGHAHRNVWAQGAGRARRDGA